MTWAPGRPWPFQESDAAFHVSEHRSDVLLACFPLPNGVLLHLRQACTAPAIRLETGFGTPDCSGQFLDPENKIAPPAWVMMPKATSFQKGAGSAVFPGWHSDVSIWMFPSPDIAFCEPSDGLSSTRWGRAHSQRHVLTARANSRPCTCTDEGQTVATPENMQQALRNVLVVPRRLLRTSKANEVPVS